MENTEHITFEFNDKLDAASLVKTYQDDLEYAFNMFSIFNDMIKDEIGLMNLFWKAEDHDNLRKVAHKIKPTFTMVGLTGFSQLLEDIENVSDQSNKKLTSSLMSEFNKEIGYALELTYTEKQRLAKALNNAK